MCGFPRATRGWHVFPLRSKGGLTPSNQPSAEEKPEKPALLAGQAQLPPRKRAMKRKSRFMALSFPQFTAAKGGCSESFHPA